MQSIARPRSGEIILAVVAITVMLLSLSIPAYAEQRVRRDEYIVVSNPKSFASRSRHPEHRLAGLAREVRKLSSDGHTQLVKVDPLSSNLSDRGDEPYDPLAHQAWCDALRVKNPDIILCEPNYKLELGSRPNDSAYSSLYGMEKISAPAAWDTTTGSQNVTVAIVDTGIDYTHPDLSDNLWTNTNETPGNGIDDDNNGYVDDYYGANAVSGSGNPYDDNGHGTHVAGTIGARGDNARGVVGVNWNVKLMGLKFLDSDGSGYTDDAITMINYAVTHGASVINASWGGGGASNSLRSAIQAAGNNGVLFIAAAGNEGENNDRTASYPANYDLDNVLSVAATDSDDALAYFSNYGATTVDIAAPGVDIYSTYPGGYATLDGTSMATPHVAGLAALVIAAYPNENYHQIRSRVLTGDAISDLAGLTTTGKRINAQAALGAPTPPSGGDTSESLEIASLKGKANGGYKNTLYRNRNFRATFAGSAGATAAVTLRLSGKRVGSQNDCDLGTVTVGSDGLSTVRGKLALTGAMKNVSSATLIVNGSSIYDTVRRKVTDDNSARSRSTHASHIRLSSDLSTTCQRILATLALEG